jgi:prepilin-type N-terminal cleavage/methylation domain-containing protein
VTGFTLIELVVVLAIISVVLSWGLAVSFGAYRQAVLSGERDKVVSLLKKARTRALSNAHETAHGVYLDQSGYTLFEGSSYAARNVPLDEVFPGSPGIAVGGISEVVFSQLAATSTASGTIMLGNGATNFAILVNYEGRVAW